mmetsp:Transcript_54186/g.100111  ORF Transcript_54186/g.100111 Transcript_54186/m.100111 type:complete len:226 (+) Transcript_54186:247-924(+)
MSASSTFSKSVFQYAGRARGSSFCSGCESGILSSFTTSELSTEARYLAILTATPHHCRKVNFSSRRTMTACLWLSVSVVLESSSASNLSSSLSLLTCCSTLARVCFFTISHAARSLARESGALQIGGCTFVSQTTLMASVAPCCKNLLSLDGVYPSSSDGSAFRRVSKSRTSCSVAVRKRAAPTTTCGVDFMFGQAGTANRYGCSRNLHFQPGVSAGKGNSINVY